jgi:hypothetical protein
MVFWGGMFQLLSLLDLTEEEMEGVRRREGGGWNNTERGGGKAKSKGGKSRKEIYRCSVGEKWGKEREREKEGSERDKGRGGKERQLE